MSAAPKGRREPGGAGAPQPVAGIPRGAGAPQPVAPGPLAASPEVVAAIAAAVEACWPRQQPPVKALAVVARHEPGAPEYVWRLSGRWWSKPVARRRDRPWSDHREHGALEVGRP